MNFNKKSTNSEDFRSGTGRRLPRPQKSMKSEQKSGKFRDFGPNFRDFLHFLGTKEWGSLHQKKKRCKKKELQKNENEGTRSNSILAPRVLDLSIHRNHGTTGSSGHTATYGTTTTSHAHRILLLLSFWDH